MQIRKVLLGAAAIMATAIGTASASPYYGTTTYGGDYDQGSVYMVKGGKKTTLYSFCAHTGCPDGAHPLSGVVELQDGSLIGTTSAGGKTNNESSGVIFRLEDSPSGWHASDVWTVCSFAPDCDKYGTPQGTLKLVAPNKVNGATESRDGHGALWAVTVTPQGNIIKPVRYW